MQEMQEVWVQSPSWENPLEKEMATHSSILACEIPRTEEPGGLQSTGSQKLDTNEQLTLRLSVTSGCHVGQDSAVNLV